MLALPGVRVQQMWRLGKRGESMNISALEDYGIPKLLIDRWRSEQGESLLRLQERAVREYGLLDGRSILISAPTSSGKTFCGEMAAAKTLTDGRKAVFLVPLKALAEERYARLREKYDPLGIRTVISTRDHAEFDGEIEQGKFDLGVIIYEKFYQMLVRNLDLLQSVRFVVVDELQMLADDSRGAVLEMILLLMLRSTYDVRIVGLSAVLSNARDLAEWMNADLLVESHRPIELRQGVLLGDSFRYRCFNSREKGDEKMSVTDESSAADLLLENVQRLATDGEQVLVFLKSKAACMQLASLLVERASFGGCEAITADLMSTERTTLAKRLAEFATNGVAFHHADLSYAERRLVEKYYLGGEIRVIFATTTLSLGLNLPAQTVFIEGYRFKQGHYSGEPVIDYVHWSDYENMSGRAGRLSFGSEFGRAILLANSDLERDMLWKKLVCGEPQQLCGKLFSRSLEDIILALIVSGCASDISQLKGLIEGSFSRLKSDSTTNDIDAAGDALTRSELIYKSERRILPTETGRKAAYAGVSAATAVAFKRLLTEDPSYSDLVWLFEFCDTLEGHRVYIPRNLREKAERIVLERFIREASADDAASHSISEIIDSPHKADAQIISRMRLAMALRDWKNGTEIREIEQSYRLFAGTIQSSAETVAWLAESAATIGSAIRVEKRRIARLKRMSFSVKHGLPSEIRKLIGPLNGLLSRSEFMLLHESGICRPVELLQSDRKFLSSIIPENKLEEVMTRILSEKNGLGARMAEPGEVKLRMTATPVRDRYRIYWKGSPLNLTSKSFKYLFKLAAWRMLESNGWIDKEQLEPGFNQARYLYNLKKEIGNPKVSGSGLIENDRKGGYRLCLEPGEIELDLNGVRQLGDFELTDIADRLEMKLRAAS